ncbi:DUF4227 family protein [Paenibacillus thailandensis]|uniref:DUF4227 family protein n=1 Tax=Paenibacillus thailandensis TaxID=393250 RepID=A0ABW5QZR9_9BACL
MIFSLRRWVPRIVFMLLFLVLLLVASGGYRLLREAITPIHPYREPKGHAVKVLKPESDTPENGSMADRLRWFYWYGE